MPPSGMAYGLPGGNLSQNLSDRCSRVASSRQRGQPAPVSALGRPQSGLWRPAAHRFDATGQRRRLVAVSVRCVGYAGAETPPTVEGPPTYVKAPGRIVASEFVFPPVWLNPLRYLRSLRVFRLAGQHSSKRHENIRPTARDVVARARGGCLRGLESSWA